VFFFFFITESFIIFHYKYLQSFRKQLKSVAQQ